MAAEHIRHWQIGDVSIARIVEVNGWEDDITMLLPDADPAFVQGFPWMRPHFATPDGKMIISFQCFVLRSQGRMAMIDTCIGNDRAREFPVFTNMQTTFLEDLAVAGFPHEEITDVLCTHLHFDHVGWNTMLKDGKWVPTFPNARYLFNRAEFEHWRDTQNDVTEDMFLNVQKVVFTDSIQPVLDAGLVDLVNEDHKVCDEVWFEPTPGHSPGHVCVRIRSEGLDAFITGDMVHHPFQFANAEWSMASVDYNSDAATATRARVYGEVADQPVLVIGTHFAGTTSGRVRRDGGSYRFDAE